MANERMHPHNNQERGHDLLSRHEHPNVIDLGNGDPDPSTDPLVQKLAAIMMMRPGKIQLVDQLPSPEEKELGVLYYTCSRPRPTSEAQ